MALFYSTKLRIYAATIFLLATNLVSVGQQLSPGPQVLTFHSDVDDTEQPYGLYLPKNYDPAKKYPLVVMLHGAGSNHRLALRRVFGKSNLPGETDVEASRYFPEWKAVEYIVVSPFARGTMGYQGVAEKDVFDAVADVKKRFSIDEDRTYLTGLSMGGGGSMWIGLSRPDMWAAVAPVCPAPPEGTIHLVPNALNFPMHFFQGDADPAVNVDSTRRWVKRLKDVGTSVEYVEYPGVGHNSWENAYKDEFIFEWFAKFRRNRYPDRVRFATSQYKHNRAYWVTFNEFTPGTPASIDAKFASANRIDVTASALNTFTLNLAGHPKFNASAPLEVIINGKSLKTKAADSLTLSQRNGKWAVGPYNPPALSKHAGAEGPMSEAIADRHIYVYGTGGNPSPEELNNRRSQAAKAADWSVDRGAFLGRVMVFPRLLSDKEVRPSDLESANLILFGTKETNSLIEKFSDKLPVQLSSSATDYGLAYVFPNGAHYILVNSGLPWWTAPETTAASPSRRISPGPMNALGKFQDYILFKGTNDNIIAEGRFDNNWHLPAQAAEKMKATGITTIQ